MSTITALKIGKETIEYIELEKPISYNQIHDILGTKEISSYVRFLDDFFRFRCYCKDYVPKPTFFSAINSDNTIDIPEECVFVLEDNEYNEELDGYEALSINHIVQQCIEKHLGYYQTRDQKQQPCIKW